MMTCKQAAEKASQGFDQPLSRRERLSLGMHLAMCRLCRAYRRQLLFLRAASERFERHLPADRTLDPAARERIRQALREEL